MDPTLQSQLYTQNYISWATIALALFEHLITLSDEVDFLWRQWRSAGSWLFCVNRYVLLVSGITSVITFIPWRTIESCDAYGVYKRIVTGILTFLVLLIMFLRMYAVYNKDKRILMLGILMLVAIIGSGASSLSETSSVVVLNPGCNFFPTASNGSIAYAVSWATIIAADIVIFSLTIIKKVNTNRSMISQRSDLMLLIFRDGVIYYVTVTCLNVANLLTLFVLPDALKGCIGSMTASVSSIIVSRMTINLFKSVQIDNESISMTEDSAVISTAVFPGGLHSGSRGSTAIWLSPYTNLSLFSGLTDHA